MGLLFYYATKVYQTEYYNSKVSKFVYEEPWTNEYDCSYQDCHTDSKGNRKCKTKHKTCTDRHRSNYYILTSNNSRINLEDSQFRIAKSKYSATEVRVKRPGQTIYSKLAGEGDIWYSYPNVIIPTVKTHKYINYLMGTEETIQKRKGEVKFPVLDYPKIIKGLYGWIYLDRVVNASLPDLENGLNIIAAKLGDKKQINPLIYVTRNDQTFKDSLSIKWANANKNDSILILGIKDNKIVWSDSINWSKNKRFGVELSRNFEDLNITQTDKILKRYQSAIENYWERLSMEDTYGYLKTEINIHWYSELYLIFFNLLINFYIYRYFNRN